MEPGEAEFEKIIEITDKVIAHGNPKEVAFWLGYRHGIRHHLFDIDSVVPSERHRRFLEVAEQGHRDKFIDAYARGYRNGIDGRPPREILGEREGIKMAEITKFQQMNGCSVCKRSKPRVVEGMLAAVSGKGFWCNHVNKAVDSKEGAACPEWAYDK